MSGIVSENAPNCIQTYDNGVYIIDKICFDDFSDWLNVLLTLYGQNLTNQFSVSIIPSRIPSHTKTGDKFNRLTEIFSKYL